MSLKLNVKISPIVNPRIALSCKSTCRDPNEVDDSDDSGLWSADEKSKAITVTQIALCTLPGLSHPGRPEDAPVPDAASNKHDLGGVSKAW